MSETWYQIIAIFIANAALIAWFRSESRSDWRHMDAKMESFRAEASLLTRAIQMEMKDFHEKLLKIEMNKK